jgi:peptidoglycan/xylan/chitin deacetylase (PgdA/CDA1 family)
MKPYFVKTPSLISFLFRNQIWSFPSKNKDLYLTFDDGPTPEITDYVLDLLTQFNAKATFFCIGKNIENHPTIFNRIMEQGHAVGNHTYEHLKGWKTLDKKYLASISRTENIINKLKKTSPDYPINCLNSKLFRPPYGKVKKSQIKSLVKSNYKLIMWTVLSADFDPAIDADQCFNNVVRNARNGSIIIFHDSIKSFKTLKHALPKVLKYYTERGYNFKIIDSERT